MELKTYVLPLLRWWWLLLIASALAAATSFWAVRQEPEQYQSRATLMIGQAIQDLNPSNNQLYMGGQLADAYADIAKREPVRQATMTALGIDWLPDYNVRTIPRSQLLEVTVIDTNPARAQAVANEIANQLVRISPGGAQEGEAERQAFIELQLDRLEEQITATEDEILTEQETLGELFSAREIADTQDEINALQAKLRTLQSTYAGLLAGTKEEAVNTLSVIEAASLPTRPVGSAKEMTILASTAIAFALAAGAAYLLEYLDDTVKSPEQVNKQFGIPVVGTIARFQNAEGGSRLIMKSAPRSPEAEGFRGLRTAIQFGLNADDAKSLLVTSPHQADGKSLVAANLGLAMAQAGQRTLLIDADLHRPTQHKLFSLGNSQGLSNILLQPEAIENRDGDKLYNFLAENGIIESTLQERLDVMTSGSLSLHPSELLVGGIVRRLLDRLVDKYDVIILDTPPVLAVSDAVAMSQQVDAVYVLASANNTRRQDLRASVEHFEGAGAHVAGFILNQLSPRSEHYYYAYYRYSDYGRAHREEKNAEDTGGSPMGQNNGFRRKLPGWFPQKPGVETSQSQMSESEGGSA